jgi:GAF domain
MRRQRWPSMLGSYGTGRHTIPIPDRIDRRRSRHPLAPTREEWPAARHPSLDVRAERADTLTAAKQPEIAQQPWSSLGRPIAHLPTEAVVGLTVERPAPEAPLDLAGLFTALDDRSTMGAGPGQIVVVAWCAAVRDALARSDWPQRFRQHKVIVELPPSSEVTDFDRATRCLAEHQLQAAISFDGDVASIIAAHERRQLALVRLPRMREDAIAGVAAIETRLGMQFLEVLDEFGVTVVVDGVVTREHAERLRRAGVRFAQGPPYDLGLPRTGAPFGDARATVNVDDYPHEIERLEMVRASRILERNADPSFAAVTRIVADRCRTSMAAVSVIDHDRQWFTAATGLQLDHTDRVHAFCADTMYSSGPFIVHDALRDRRYADNPLVVGDPFIRSYLGVALRASNGLPFGALCAIDTQARVFAEHEIQEVEALARLVTDSLELSVMRR